MTTISDFIDHKTLPRSYIALPCTVELQLLLTLQVNRYCIFTVQRRVHHHDHACDVKIIMTYCQSKVSPDTPRLQKQLL